MQMEPRGKWRRVQRGSLLVTERRTVRTIATPRHSPFISRHRRMKNHCESATSVRINITKPPEGRKGRRRRGRGGGRRRRASFPVRPKSDPMTSRISHTRHSLNLLLLSLLFFLRIIPASFVFSAPSLPPVFGVHAPRHDKQTARTDV